MEPLTGFNVRAQVVGPSGQYVKHIQQETRCRVQIKGRGSGFMEHATGRESDDPMYLHVAGPDPKEVVKAKELCEDLLNNVRTEYERFKANPPAQHHGSYTDGYGANASSSNYGSYRSNSRNDYSSGYSSAAPGTSGSPTSQTDYYSQYYGANNGGQASGTDPYAAWGGYQNYLAYYQYYAQQQQQQSATPASGGETAAAPPPPPSSSPPPPPPGGSSGYNSVPPPPGM